MTGNNGQFIPRERTGSSPYFVRVDDFSGNEWERVLSCFKDASLYQTRAQGRVRWGDEAISLIAVCRDNEIRAAAQVILKKIPVLRFGIANVRWGPMWRRKGKTEVLDDLKEILSAIRKEYAEKRGLVVRIVPREADEPKNLALTFVDAGYRHIPGRDDYSTLVMDLRPSLGELRANLHSKWRAQLKKSEKEDLVVDIHHDTDSIREIARLTRQLEKRKGFKGRIDYESFLEIQDGLSDENKLVTFICRKDDRILSAVTVATIGERAVFLFGGNAPDLGGLHPANFLHWFIVGWLRENSYSELDLGGVDREINPGVYHYKTGLAGKESRETRFAGRYQASSGIVRNIFSYVIDPAIDLFNRFS